VEPPWESPISKYKIYSSISCRVYSEEKNCWYHPPKGREKTTKISCPVPTRPQTAILLELENPDPAKDALVQARQSRLRRLSSCT
jgi:hypothetical protein